MVAQTRGGYAKESADAIQNATEIYQYLSSKGWTVNAICGILGNMDVESGYNPFRWEGDNVQSYYATNYWGIGYGLFQFTADPTYYPEKYIREQRAISLSGYAPNFSDVSGNVSDGITQLEYVDRYADYIMRSDYPLTYSEYKQSLDSADYLASVWLWNYERPNTQYGQQSEPTRRAAANYWYGVLSGLPPQPPTRRKHLPIWVYANSNNKFIVQRRLF